MTTDTAPLETRVPPGESPAECPYCERPLESEDLLALHKGLDHWEDLSDPERETFREVYADETESLRTFRLKILGILVVVYFGFLFVYSYYTTNPFSAALLAFAVPERVRALR
ncbi:DUF7410 domain-containing protein [Halorussus amylolyticus]|uniref:DUF7410 domain-containing protein n=1 Tax=Halorussus amylolyticus TaxID=1126242 RepID=UPI001EE4B1EB|nr:C2H2-type zinc finger protein [Halorussus amylolyticus]